MREDGDMALSDGWAQLNICWSRCLLTRDKRTEENVLRSHA